MKQEFSRAEALRYLGIKGPTLRGWERLGLVEPAREYSFEQVVAMRALARLHAAKLPARKIQSALRAIERKLREVKNPLTELRLYSEGSRIRVQVGPHHMEPESGQLLLNFGQAELERLVALPAEARQADPRLALKRQREAEAHFQHGVEVEQSGLRIEEAIAAYEKAIELDPHLAAAHVNLGTIYFTARDWPKAAACYQRAIDLNPDYALAHFNLGNLYDEQREHSQALAHYQAALKLDPAYADAHYNIALLYQATGQVLKSVRHWRAYLKLDPASRWAVIAKRELEKLNSRLLINSPGARS